MKRIAFHSLPKDGMPSFVFATRHISRGPGHFQSRGRAARPGCGFTHCPGAFRNWRRDAAATRGGGEFEAHPESETDFFLKINGAQLAFIKNGIGEVTSVIHRIAGLLDCDGKKLESE